MGDERGCEKSAEEEGGAEGLESGEEERSGEMQREEVGGEEGCGGRFSTRKKE
mgnify:CR=1 FL=1